MQISTKISEDKNKDLKAFCNENRINVQDLTALLINNFREFDIDLSSIKKKKEASVYQKKKFGKNGTLMYVTFSVRFKRLARCGIVLRLYEKPKVLSELRHNDFFKKLYTEYQFLNLEIYSCVYYKNTQPHVETVRWVGDLDHNFNVLKNNEIGFEELFYKLRDETYSG